MKRGCVCVDILLHSVHRRYATLMYCWFRFCSFRLPSWGLRAGRQSVVYLLWSVDRMICFCEAQSGLCCFLGQRERLLFSSLSIRDIAQWLLTFRKPYFGQAFVRCLCSSYAIWGNMTNINFCFHFLQSKDLIFQALIFERGMMWMHIWVSLPHTFHVFKIL